jgi:ankyrin repeat protein
MRVLGCVVAVVVFAGSASAQNAAASHQATIQQHCITCHSQRLKTGGLVLEGLELANVQMMRILLEAKADVTATQKSGNSPLMLCAGAISGGNSEDTPERVSEAEALAAIRLALDAGVDVNAQNTAGDTVLHTAATTGGGQPALIRLLVERGARLDVKNKADRTPLDAASRARQPSQHVIELLKELTR